ncbi:amidohydrolase [Croceicoccus estronivorus]|uniref:amidohydrolase family protein n=1 Tax=Croceicoccus estronivorus TaxID=1172626 RepID=UPI000836FADA|nr:amidohydrolase family protein [Croceicoccus estronivorus]OCC23542.1 amidohydrolase [Croceicoccus estronivorus]
MATNAAEKLISVDSHVYYTDEWVTERLPERLRERWVEGRKLHEQRELDRRGGFIPDINDLMDPIAWNDPGHYAPDAKLKAMDRDGVFAEVIFPEVGGAKMCSPDIMGDDWQAMLSGFNDAIADFASIDTERLMCAYQLLPHDIEGSVKEVERVAQRGARCVQLPPFPTELGLPDYFDARYDPLWSVLSETGITVLNHLDQNAKSYELIQRDPTPMKGVALGLPGFQLAETLCFWILSGTLERFPKLKVLFVEPGLGWLPFLFDTILDGRILQGHYKFPALKMLPSEYFKRQMGATFMYEPLGLKYCYEYFGPDCLYWSTDFPHPATSWPNSRELMEKQFAAAGVSDDDRRKITCENGLKMFALA